MTAIEDHEVKKHARKPKVIMVEDDARIARRCVMHTGIDKIIDDVDYVTNKDQLPANLRNDDSLAICWVDVNLGESREKEGVEIIKMLRESYQDALIIAYSAYPEYDEICRLAGANHFFQKSNGQYDEMMQMIQDIMLAFLAESRNATAQYLNVIQHVANIAHVDRDWVKLGLNINGKQRMKICPIMPINAAIGKGVLVNDNIKVNIIEKGPEIKITFSKLSEELRQAAQNKDEHPGNDIPGEIFGK